MMTVLAQMFFDPACGERQDDHGGRCSTFPYGRAGIAAT